MGEEGAAGRGRRMRGIAGRWRGRGEGGGDLIVDAAEVLVEVVLMVGLADVWMERFEGGGKLNASVRGSGHSVYVGSSIFRQGQLLCRLKRGDRVAACAVRIEFLLRPSSTSLPTSSSVRFLFLSDFPHAHSPAQPPSTRHIFRPEAPATREHNIQAEWHIIRQELEG